MKNSDLKDIELIREFKGGNKESGNKIAQEYYEYVYKMTFRWVRIFSKFNIKIDENEAEDLTQEIFKRFLDSLFAYDERFSSPQTWIMNIGKNASIDYIRKKIGVAKKRGKQVTPNEKRAAQYEAILRKQIRRNTLIILFPKEKKATQYEETLRNQIRQKAKKTLTSMEFQIYELIISGYTQEEISEIRGMPLGTVKTISSRILKKLREAFLPPPAGISVPRKG